MEPVVSAAHDLADHWLAGNESYVLNRLADETPARAAAIAGQTLYLLSPEGDCTDSAAESFLRALKASVERLGPPGVLLQRKVLP